MQVSILKRSPGFRTNHYYFLQETWKYFFMDKIEAEKMILLLIKQIRQILDDYVYFIYA